MREILVFSLLLTTVVLVVNVVRIIGLSGTPADFGLSVMELIRKYGYPIEIHSNIQTEDGYLLEMHRIPHGKKNDNIQDRPAVLLAHCFLCSSAEWIYMGPKKSLGYILADNGYDVWLGNYRGNTWSRKHVSLNPDNKTDASFWDFSFHELGQYDLPAMVDHIIKITGQKKIFIIGHSQGTATSFIMLSSRPEYNAKVRLLTTFAPAARLTHLTNPVFKFFLDHWPTIHTYLKLFGINEFLPKSDILPPLSLFGCSNESVFQNICLGVLYRIVGKHPKQFNKAMVPIIVSSTPAGSSVKTLEHFRQAVRSGNFSAYDYGPEGNLQHYGTVEPLTYNMQNIVAPVAAYYGEGDDIVVPKDVEDFVKLLPNVAILYKMEDKKWHHLDFIWAIDAPTLLYNKVMEVMERF